MGRAARLKRLQRARQTPPDRETRKETQVVARSGLGGQPQYFDVHSRTGQSGGSPGDYRVVFYLQRLGHALHGETLIEFDVPRGNSHIGIVAPAHPEHPAGTKLEFNMVTPAGEFRYNLLPNNEGFLARISTTVTAQNFVEAERLAYRGMSPMLSHWSTCFDIPLVIERIELKELQSGALRMLAMSPYDVVPMAHFPAQGIAEGLRVLESFYREGMNSNSPAYQFLCFAKIAEAVLTHRVRNGRAATRSGQAIAEPPDERIPAAEEEFAPWLTRLFPARQRTWDAESIASVFIAEARGRTIQELFRRSTRDVEAGAIWKLRNTVAHAIASGGFPMLYADAALHLHSVVRWVPLTKCIARVLLLQQYPQQLWHVEQSPQGARIV